MSGNDSGTTLRAAKDFTRRTLLTTALGAGAAAALGPWIARRPLAASGEVNVFAWGDYVGAFNDGGIIKAFEDKSGITVNLSTYGSNDELLNKLRTSGGEGFDVVFPAVTDVPNFHPQNLLMPLDESRIETGNIIPSVFRNSVRLGATYRGERYAMPFDWGTESITYDTRAHDLAPSDLSYGTLWADEGMAKRVALRQKSCFIGLALYLDATGEVPSDRARDLYKTEADARRVFDACLAYAVKRKGNIGAYWNNATEATTAFTDAGCTVGQTWDTTGIRLHKEVDPRWRYGMAKEGGITWLDSMAMPAKAANVEQGYAFINHLLTPESGGRFAEITGYNSAVRGHEAFLSEASRAAYRMAYPPEALDNLWWWQPVTPWFTAMQGEYAEKLTNA